MNIAVIGLGIIGGSFCKAIKSHTHHHVIGFNRTLSTAQQALSDGAIDEIGDEAALGRADIIILCMYPRACVDYISQNGKYIKKRRSGDRFFGNQARGLSATFGARTGVRFCLCRQSSHGG